MCAQCREIAEIWSKETKTPEEITLLRQKVPERFVEVHRYWDDVWVMWCTSCSATTVSRPSTSHISRERLCISKNHRG